MIDDGYNANPSRKYVRREHGCLDLPNDLRIKPAVERSMGEIIGRQPAADLRTPSKTPFAWYGPREGDERTGFGGYSVTGRKRFVNEGVLERSTRAASSRGYDSRHDYNTPLTSRHAASARRRERIGVDLELSGNC